MMDFVATVFLTFGKPLCSPGACRGVGGPGPRGRSARRGPGPRRRPSSPSWRPPPARAIATRGGRSAGLQYGQSHPEKIGRTIILGFKFVLFDTQQKEDFKP